MTLAIRTRNTLFSSRISSLSFLLLAAATAGAIITPNYVHPANSTFVVTTTGAMTLTSALSQTKVTKGESANLFLKLTLTSPDAPPGNTVRAPVDMVVVLDRSGSMGDPKKLPYAKKAIEDLIGQLSPEDRFALVTFDNEVVLDSPLEIVTSAKRDSLMRSVEQITPGGSTNISGGLEKAREILSTSPSSRKKRVLLLTDGEANVGITEIGALSQMGKNFSPFEANLSTIGLGLDFNQSLLSSMADYGMGYYSYLEDLSKLSNILAQNLSDARARYASGGAVTLSLADGITLNEASGYPIEWMDGAHKTARIPIGEILYGGQKGLTLSLTTTPESLGTKKNWLGTALVSSRWGTELTLTKRGCISA